MSSSHSVEAKKSFREKKYQEQNVPVLHLFGPVENEQKTQHTETGQGKNRSHLEEGV